MDSPGAVFRLAHISDLHLGEVQGLKGYLGEEGFLRKLGVLLGCAVYGDARPIMGTYSSQNLRALVRALSAKTAYVTVPYDALLVTGDLATTGWATDLAVASAFFQGKPIAGSHDLSNSFTPSLLDLVLLPGNHDRYEGKRLLPKSNQFESGQHFGPFWRPIADAHAEKRSVVNSLLLSEKNGQRLAIVTVDFSYSEDDYPKGFWKYFGQGLATTDTVNLLAAETKKYTDKQIAVVWAMHFPPEISGVKRTLRLERSSEVVKAARESNVEIIFSGHTHEANPNLQVTRNGGFTGVRVVSAGTPCATGEGEKSYFDVELKVGGSRVSIHKVTKMAFTSMRKYAKQTFPATNSAEFCPVP